MRRIVARRRGTRQWQECQGSIDSRQMHQVAVLALESVVAFDLATPAQVFRGPYGFELCGVRGGPVATSTGFAVVADHGLEALARADTVIVPGYDTIDRPPPAPALEALRAAHARGARMVSICTGAFALAHAGLLDGRRATTHWRYAAQLAERFPAVDVDPDVLYVDEGDVLTSAGVAAGIDLCLHIVRRDHGAEVAARVARRIVVAPHRDGGQAQFVERPLPTGASDGLAATRAWALEHLDRALDVAALARHAAVSERTFARRFRAETGITPLQWLLAQRVREAERLLEGTDLPVEEVAARCGFGTAASLREHFARVNATTPSGYRRAFRGSVGGSTASILQARASFAR
jgi:transcriptional regulator GlxA family with amidase domain